MYDPRVASLLAAFDLTPETLAARETVGTYINSFATVIVDAFSTRTRPGGRACRRTRPPTCPARSAR